MKHVSGFLGIFGGAVALAAAYFLMDYAAKEVTFAALILGALGTALHFTKSDPDAHA